MPVRKAKKKSKPAAPRKAAPKAKSAKKAKPAKKAASAKKSAAKKPMRASSKSSKALFANSSTAGMPKLRKMTRLVAPKAAPSTDGRESGRLEDDPTSGEILSRLRSALAPSSILIKNLSRAHKGHAESKKHGGGHYALFVVSDLFHGLGRIQREQWIHSLLADLIESKRIHALQMLLKDDNEASTIVAQEQEAVGDTGEE